MMPLGTAMPTFELPTADSLLAGDRRTIASQSLTGVATLVAFLCNHCPYVKHIENQLGVVLKQFPELSVVGICSNDDVEYPDDGPAGLIDQHDRAGWDFPYLIDETSDVARAYRAAATPDFFLYGPDRTLVYRGAFDESSPGNGKPVTGDALTQAIQLTLAGKPVPEPQLPSLGCSIKFRAT